MAKWGSSDHKLHAKHGQLNRYRKEDTESLKEALERRAHLHMERDALIHSMGHVSGEKFKHIDAEIERVDAEISRIDAFIIDRDADLRAELDEINRRLDEHDISIAGATIMYEHLMSKIDEMASGSQSAWFSDEALGRRRRQRGCADE